MMKKEVEKGRGRDRRLEKILKLVKLQTIGGRTTKVSVF